MGGKRNASGVTLCPNTHLEAFKSVSGSKTELANCILEGIRKQIQIQRTHMDHLLCAGEWRPRQHIPSLLPTAKQIFRDCLSDVPGADTFLSSLLNKVLERYY